MASCSSPSHSWWCSTRPLPTSNTYPRSCRFGSVCWPLCRLSFLVPRHVETRFVVSQWCLPGWTNRRRSTARDGKEKARQKKKTRKKCATSQAALLGPFRETKLIQQAVDCHHKSHAPSPKIYVRMHAVHTHFVLQIRSRHT